MPTIDRYDAVVVAGVVMTGTGLWLVDPALVLVAAGVGIVAATVLLAQARGGN